MTLWRVHAPAVALTVTGVTMLELYRSPDEAKSGRPQYARMFRDGEFFTAHPGTLCATRGTAATVQVLATTEPITSSDRPLPIPAYAHGVQRARRALEHASLALIGEVC
ncbi:hypothetical protein [Streptomyces sp. NPDC001621]|uniref:hypothetical protein n=1 Tax=Streptomyces sp. NPDC001621 TaxID=3364594 RepID=UPI003685755B